MTAPARSDYLELADYTGPLRRHWPTIVVCTLLGVALAAAYYMFAPRTYTATDQVQVNALPQSANALGGRTSGPVNMDNEAQIVLSAGVADRVAAQLGVPASSLTSRLHVTVPPNTTVMQISCGMRTKKLAYACARAAGPAFLEQQRSTLFDQATSALQRYQTEAQKLQLDLTRNNLLLKGSRLSATARAQAAYKAATDTAKLKADEAKIASLGPLSTSLQLQTNPSTGKPIPGSNTVLGSILTQPTLPSSPSSPRKLIDGPAGLAGGLIIGLVVAFVRDRRRPRLHSARDAERQFGLPVLLSLTTRTAGGATLASPKTPAGQAYTELALYAARTLGDGKHVIAVASTSAGASGSVVAANLAAALARTRAQTVLICGDARLTSVPQLLSLGDGTGLAELLDGTAGVADVVWSAPDAYRLGVITPGQDIDSIPYTLEHDTVRQLIAELQQDARYVVIEVRATDSDGAFGLAEFADAAIIVTEVEETSAADLTSCLQRLDRLGTPVLGTAVLPPMRRLARTVPTGDGGRPARRKEQRPEPERAKPVQGRSPEPAQPAQRGPAAGNGHGPDAGQPQHGARPAAAGAARPFASPEETPGQRKGNGTAVADDQLASSGQPSRPVTSAGLPGQGRPDNGRSDNGRPATAENQPRQSALGEERRAQSLADDRRGQSLIDDRRGQSFGDDRRSLRDDRLTRPLGGDRGADQLGGNRRPESTGERHPQPAGEESGKDSAARSGGSEGRGASPSGRSFSDPLYFDSVPAHKPRNAGWQLPGTPAKPASGTPDKGDVAGPPDPVPGS